jgi:hypothetical protein
VAAASGCVDPLLGRLGMAERRPLALCGSDHDSDHSMVYPHAAIVAMDLLMACSGAVDPPSHANMRQGKDGAAETRWIR